MSDDAQKHARSFTGNAKAVDRAVMAELERQQARGVKYLVSVNVDDLVAAICAALSSDAAQTFTDPSLHHRKVATTPDEVDGAKLAGPEREQEIRPPQPLDPAYTSRDAAQAEPRAACTYCGAGVGETCGAPPPKCPERAASQPTTAAYTAPGCDDLLETMRHGHACPIANEHYAWAVAEIDRLRERAIRSPDPDWLRRKAETDPDEDCEVSSLSSTQRK